MKAFFRGVRHLNMLFLGLYAFLLPLPVGKVYTRFQTKTAQKPVSLRWHIPIRLYKEVPPRALF